MGGTTMTNLIGLALAAGVCYYVYRVIMSKQNKKPQPGKKKPRRSSLLEMVAGIPVLVSPVHIRGSGASENRQKPSGNLEPHHLDALLQLLVSSTNSATREQILVTLANSAAFSINQNIIRDLGGIEIIADALGDPKPEVKAKALIALTNLSMLEENQEKIKIYVKDACSFITSSPLNSELQQTALQLLINMMVTNNYQNLTADYISCFLSLLVEGNQSTRIHAVKLLVNLSANSLMTKCLLSSKAPRSLASLLDSSTHKEILIRTLTFVANLSDNAGIDPHNKEPMEYAEDSVFMILFGHVHELQKSLTSLLAYPDMEVKEQVVRILLGLHRLIE